MNRFKKTYIRFYPDLVSYAMKIVKSQDVAEDIVQEVFLKIWKDGEFRKIKKLDNYLVFSVKNKCIDYLRKHGPKNTISLEILKKEFDIINSKDIDRTSEDKELELITQLHCEINNLSPKCREIFMLVKFHGYTYQQAAEYYNISVSMVKKHVSKGLQHIRKKLIP